MEDILSKLKDFREIQGRKGTIDQGDYMVGMYNGIEFCIGLIENRAPDYKDPKAFIKSEGMTFGEAIEAMKQDNKVARKGWNGMWITISEGYKNLEVDKVWNEHNKQVAIENGGTVTISPYITMKTADNKIQPGWNASQADMLANDWMIVK